MKVGRVCLLQVVILVLVTGPSGCGASFKTDWNKSLHEALDGVTKLRVRSGGTCHRVEKNEKTLLVVTDAKGIAALIHGIEIDGSKSGFHCMCCGNPSLEFYRGDRLILTLGFHHGRSLRWSDGEWAGDGLLTQSSADFLIKWLNDRGVDGPKKDREESLVRKEQERKSENKWQKTMPSSLRPYWRSMQNPFGSKNTGEMSAAMAKEYPEKEARIMALLGWYGSGEGQWSGYASYEDVPQQLLLQYKTEDILQAVRNKKLTEREVEGTARFFACWDFSQTRPQDLRLLSVGLKRKLLEHSLKCADEDKKERAKAAFEDAR